MTASLTCDDLRKNKIYNKYNEYYYEILNQNKLKQSFVWKKYHTMLHPDDASPPF